MHDDGRVTADQAAESEGLIQRVFGTPAFFRLWIAQVVSATGDWLGFLAIAALASELGDENAGAAVGTVLSARLIPGLFLSAAAGVIADRFDRKRLMVFCDIGRASVLFTLPFVDSIAGLFLASLVLEAFTLLWQPAKEASVPHLVPKSKLTSANSLNMAAAYGTLPIAAGLFAVLGKFSENISRGWFADALKLGREGGMAFYVDGITFLIAAALVATLLIPKVHREPRGEGFDALGPLRDLKEAWVFIAGDPIVRSVNLGLATGLIGGGMLVPLGPQFLDLVAGGGQASFGITLFAMGLGMATGVLGLSIFQERLPKTRLFVLACLVAGVSLFLAASMSTLAPILVFIYFLGLCAGVVYVLGFTLLHENTADDMRGRIFSALYTLVRLCVILAFVLGGFLADLLDLISDRLVGRDISLFGWEIAVPGVRITLWLAALFIFAAGLVAARSLRGAVKK